MDTGCTRRDVLRAGAALGLGATLGAHDVRSAGAGALQASPVAEEVQVIVGDVVDYSLEPNGWEGHFGSVTLTMHSGFFNGGDAWFIRTDASDQAFAAENGLVYVPLLKNALDVEGAYANLYLFPEGAGDQRPVFSTAPSQETYNPAWRLHNVTFAGEPELLDSEEAIRAAETAGTVTIEATECVVNYPLVLWPDGGLPVDPDLVQPLGPGILVSEPDTAAGTVTFKLHQCYPGSRYIATDTSALPMAGMMGVVGSAPTQLLLEAKATAPIYVFMPGLPGPAAMGGQPSVFNSKAGDPIWSPFWEHITVAWNEGATPRVLTTEAEILEAETAAEVQLFKGVPETDPMSFVVNCPAPILAANTYDPADFPAPRASPTA
ncbi:MAG: DUF7482 domain-containing protein [Thermomicrobiales bacterium]